VNIAIFGALSDDKFKSKQEPLIDLQSISKVYLYRYGGNPFSQKYSSKVVYSKKFRFSKYIYYLYSFFSILSLAVRKKINLLIGTYFLPFGILVGIVGIITKTPYILILPGSDLKWIVEKRRFLYILRRSAKIAVRGSNSLDKLKKLGIASDKIFTLHNYFDFPKVNETNSGQKEWDVIFIGYFRKLKRLDVLVDVIDNLKKEYPNIKCVLLGDGDQTMYIKQLIKDKKLENNIELAGHKSDTLYYLNNSKIFLLTSESEGLPMVLVEAMSQGVPVVTSDINDISNIVAHDYNGFLVQSLKKEEYIMNMKKLMSDEILYTDFSNNARKSMEDFHRNFSSFSAIKLKWQEVISQKRIFYNQ